MFVRLEGKDKTAKCVCTIFQTLFVLDSCLHFHSAELTKLKRQLVSVLLCLSAKEDMFHLWSVGWFSMKLGWSLGLSPEYSLLTFVMI